MTRLLLLLLFPLAVHAQQPADLDDLIAAQAVLRAAQADYDAKRDRVVARNAALVEALNLAADAETISTMRAELDALKARDAARKVAAQAALDAAAKATTILGLRLVMANYWTSEAK